MNSLSKELIGEFIGTAIIVFFGCGSVASAILFESFGSLFEISMVWCFGVTLAIYASRKWSPAHLNPAVSVAMWLSKKITAKQLGLYSLFQLAGGVFGAAVLYAIFSPTIEFYEATHGIVRGTPDSIVTASMFGEFFPNPGFAAVQGEVSQWQAMGAEALGTFVLVYMIFWLTAKDNLSNLTPLFIGMTVAGCICLLAPISQGGFNPARDFGPRIWAYFSGWGDAALPAPSMSFLTVYIVGPITGAAVAAGLFRMKKVAD